MPTNAIFSYPVIDAQSKRAPVTFHAMVPDAATLQQVHDAWVVMGTNIQSICAGKVGGGSVKLTFAQDVNWRDVPLDYARLADGGLFDFSLANLIYRTSVVIPALADDALDASNKINITDAGVRAVINALVSGFGQGNAYTGVDRFGNDMNGFLGCRTTGRGYRKQLAAKTFVSGSNYVP